MVVEERVKNGKGHFNFCRFLTLLHSKNSFKLILRGMQLFNCFKSKLLKNVKFVITQANPFIVA